MNTNFGVTWQRRDACMNRLCQNRLQQTPVPGNVDGKKICESEKGAIVLRTRNHTGFLYPYFI